MSDRVTVKDEADFVITMIERDLGQMMTDNKRLTYLKIIGDHIDDVGNQILGANPEACSDPALQTADTIGEDRDELDELDIEFGGLISALQNAMPGSTIVPISNRSPDPTMDIISKLFDATRPEGFEGMNPVDFMMSGDCLQDADAHEWLYSRKYAHGYDHIHVFKHDLCLLMHDDSTAISWIEPDGVREEGRPMHVLKAMFQEYVRREKNA